MFLPLFLGPLGIPELLIILFIVFLIFGGRKLPQLGAGLGEGIRNFKKAFRGDDQEVPPPKNSAGKDV